jgi:hypothetical protein
VRVWRTVRLSAAQEADLERRSHVSWDQLGLLRAEAERLAAKYHADAEEPLNECWHEVARHTYQPPWDRPEVVGGGG